MSADKNPTTSAALMAERDRKIAGRNAVPGLSACCFLARIHGREFYSAATDFLIRESQEVRDLRGFLVIDCNGYMKFFSAHCGRR
jgi:hypothetical protein